VQPGQDPTRRMDATRRIDGPPTERAAPTDRFDGYPVLGGRYRLEGLLGAGGMADVHRAEDLRLHRPVAVKVFRPGTDPDGERRFRSEAQTLANLRHPGLVAVHDFAVEGGRAYLVMELVDGPTLADELKREPYDAASATRVGLELAQVLAYVHEQGVVHRDIKPSNVLVDHDGRMRLADFGIARLVDSSGLTSVDDAIGTMPYLAPEQVCGDPVGPPADVYALGLVLLESLSGRRVFPGDDWSSAEQRLDRPPAVPSGLPEPLRSTLRAMTDPDPRRRPDAREVAERLSRMPVEPPVREDGGGRRTALVALAVVALLLGVVVFALTRGGDEPTDVVAAPDTTTSAPETTEDAAPEDAAPEDTATPEDTGDSGGDGGISIPDLPDIPSDLPDIPEIPTDIPQIPDDVQQDARNAWEQFTDWLSQFF
jgi:serine/threonine protein kinase